MNWRGSEDRAFDPMQMPPVPAGLPGAECIAKTCKEKKPPERAISKYLQVERAVSELIAINVQVFGTFP